MKNNRVANRHRAKNPGALAYGVTAGQDQGFPASTRQVMTAWSCMDIAKHYPGEIESPFVAGMNIVSSVTGCIRHNTVAVATAALESNEASNQPLGTNDYLIVLYCPALSALYGDSSFGESAKIAGLNIIQTDDLHTETATRFADFWDPHNGYSMTDVY
jgi:hypothetical protein